MGVFLDVAKSFAGMKKIALAEVDGNDEKQTELVRYCDHAQVHRLLITNAGSTK